MVTDRKSLVDQFQWLPDEQALTALRQFTRVIEARLLPLEGDRASAQQVIEDLREFALQRINEVLEPAYEAIGDQLATGFTAERISDAGPFGRDVLRAATRTALLDLLALAVSDVTGAAKATDGAFLRPILSTPTINDPVIARGTMAGISATGGTFEGATLSRSIITNLAANATGTMPVSAAWVLAYVGPIVTAINAALATRVRSDMPTALNAAQKATARANIEAGADLGYAPIEQGGGAGQLTNRIRIGWSGSQLKATVDNVDLGAILTPRNFSAGYFNAGVIGEFAPIKYWLMRTPDGVIYQGGSYPGTTDGAGNCNMMFPSSFPNECHSPIAMNGGTEVNVAPVIGVFSTTRQAMNVRFGPGVANQSVRIAWFAVGR